MESRREFLRKASMLAGSASLVNWLPASIQQALAIDPADGSSWRDAEHIVLLMQENRSFDHTYGTLQGVRGFNDPRAISLPNKNSVWLQSDKTGRTFAPFHLDIKGTNATWMSSLPHSWANQVDARNEGKYDQWLNVKHSGNDEYASMPLTMGYYNRQDIPFYYALADAFTVCDQNFCSSLTGTTPNRLYFWTGTIRENPTGESRANVWNEDAVYENMVSWKTFPERLEEAGVSWKVYQNEISVGTGFEGDEEPWLANFGDNPLEYFTQYHVKLSPSYINNLPKTIEGYRKEISKQEQLRSQEAAGSKKYKEIDGLIGYLNKYLQMAIQDKDIYTMEKFNQLSAAEKNLHEKAFSNNKNDPDYHHLTSLKYREGNVDREVMVPKGDVLHQFRQDVDKGQLPTVSWLVAPENFSDHPSSAWYGAWYISEVMDILTKNPEVWKKTIFVLTYDENDGYFDHVPPFVAPNPAKPGSGKASAGIPLESENVTTAAQSSSPGHVRESSIGLGYRVPLVIASPWSRGGWVCSEVFDHTSSLQFLENFLSQKTAKKIEEANISAWRRTICGDLSSAFRPWKGEKIELPEFIQRDPFIESIYNAKFKQVPDNFRQLTADDIALANSHPRDAGFLPKQEKGIRNACAVPYELYADGSLNADRSGFDINMQSGNAVFGKDSGGAPFQVYAPGKYQQEQVRTWAYGVKAGDQLSDHWPIADFENNSYHLRLYGPNGFFREFMGNNQDPALTIRCRYEPKRGGPALSGNLVLELMNQGTNPISISIHDNAYGASVHNTELAARGQSKANSKVVIDLSRNFNWYDVTVTVNNQSGYAQRFAGRVETGQPGKTDPVMGGLVG